MGAADAVAPDVEVVSELKLALSGGDIGVSASLVTDCGVGSESYSIGSRGCSSGSDSE